MRFKNLRIFGCYVEDGSASTSTEGTGGTEKSDESSAGKSGKEKETPPAKLDKKTEDAVRFYEALNDPLKAPTLVKSMAKNLGISFSDEEAEDALEKKNKKGAAASETLETDIKKALGPGWEFAADAISRAVSVAVDRLVEEKTKGIREEVTRTSMGRVAQDIETALEKIDKEFDLSEKVSERVQELMTQIKAQPGENPYDYLKTLIYRASSELDEPLAKKSPARINRVRQNAEDGFGNLRNFKGGGDRKAANRGTMTLDESIRAAMEEVG